MKALGWILAGSLVLALLKIAIQAMAVAIVLGVSVGLWLHPRETLGVMVVTALAGAFSAHPVWATIAVGVLGATSIVVNRAGGREGPMSPPRCGSASER